MQREQIARDTVQILKQGEYESPSGRRIVLAADLLACVNNTQCYEPEALAGIRDRVLAQPAAFAVTIFEVADETTLQGSARLAVSEEDSRIGVLNFASARNPGGGFLAGAQEESLARSSGLYHSLLKCPSYYHFHRTHRSGLYSDRMIYSPHCPVFRRDDGALLEQAYWVDFITAPAPNAGAVQQNGPSLVPQIEGVLRERASKLLGLAAHHRCEVLVLGAWGCGVFRNDPAMVAGIFRELLVRQVGSIGDAFGRWYLLYWIHRRASGPTRPSWNVLRPDVGSPNRSVCESLLSLHFLGQLSRHHDQRGHLHRCGHESRKLSGKTVRIDLEMLSTL